MIRHKKDIRNISHIQYLLSCPLNPLRVLAIALYYVHLVESESVLHEPAHQISHLL